MRRRLSTICIPFLAILLMAWGTCPCLYAEVLSGGLIRLDASLDSPCGCGVEIEDDCADDERSVNAGDRPVDDRCPCIDTVGTMHELPQVEEHDLHTGSDLSLAAQFVVLPTLGASAQDHRLDAPPGSDPGPAHPSVVLLV